MRTTRPPLPPLAADPLAYNPASGRSLVALMLGGIMPPHIVRSRNMARDASAWVLIQSPDGPGSQSDCRRASSFTHNKP